jgi:peptidoglycan/LPS O-acetylase OafA/YrhL
VALALGFATLAYERGERAGLWSLTLQTWLSVLLLASCLAPSRKGYRALMRFLPLRALGKVSYSIYLWQQLFLVTRTPDWGFVRRPGIDLVCALGVGVAAYFLVERPCLLLKDRIGARGSVAGGATLQGARALLALPGVKFVSRLAPSRTPSGGVSLPLGQATKPTSKGQP